MAIKNIQLARLEGMTSVPMEHGEEGTGTQTWIQGSPLIFNGQRLDEAGYEPTNNIMGIAMADASGVSDTDVIYLPVSSDMIFEGNIGTSVTAGDIAAGDMNALFPLALSGTDWFVDKTDNNNPCVRVVRFREAVGTTNGRVYFKFIEDSLAFAN